MTFREAAKTTAREISIALAFTTLAVVLTWPLARLLPIAVAYPGDPLINSWVLSWNVHALTHAPGEIFHANIFFPAKYALAFSENLFGLLPLALPLSFAFSPLTVHNILLITGIAFSAYGAYVLGRTATGSITGGIVAGVIYGFIPWRFTHLTHLQHAWGGWLPLLFAALLYFARKPTSARAALIAAAFLMNGLTNLHYLVFGAVAAAVIALIFVAASRELRAPRALLQVGAALVVPSLLLAALLWPYREAQQLYDVRGSAAETALYTASIGDWANGRTGEPERHVFPGVIALIAAAFGIAAAHRAPTRLPFYAAIALVAVGFLFSFGRANPLYALAFDYFAPISGIRAPARWAVLAYCGLAVLAAFSVASRRRFVAAIVCIAAIVQVFDVPKRWFLMPRRVTPVYDWLRETPVAGGVMELPIGQRDFHYLYGAAHHHKPIFNGASGAAPRHYIELQALFSAPRIPDSAVALLKRLGGSTIVLHSDALGANREEVRRWIRDALARREIGYVRYLEAGLSGDFIFTIGGRGNPPDEALKGWLERDVIAWHDAPFGALELPLNDGTLRGPLNVRGWALGGAGIRRVDLWFGNKACRVSASLDPYPQLQRDVPQYSTDVAMFTATIPSRPCGTEDNDLLVELTDHVGRRRTLPHVWFRWE